MPYLSTEDEAVSPYLAGIETAKSSFSLANSDATRDVFFSCWKQLPNGYGVHGCSVVPHLALVAKLSISAPTLYWFRAPPPSGKTALGKILEEHGWKYMEVDFMDHSNIHGLN